MKLLKESSRIYATGENGAVIAEVTFPGSADGTATIDHTFVDPSLRGQGVAAQLLEAAYEAIKADGKKAVATCPYAITWFDEHPDKRDILALHEKL